MQWDHRSPDDISSQSGLRTASTRLSAEPRFSVSWAPSCEGTRRVVYARYGGGAVAGKKKKEMNDEMRSHDLIQDRQK